MTSPVSEAFTVKGNDDEGVIAKIDGLIEYKGYLYLVEINGSKSPLIGEIWRRI